MLYSAQNADSEFSGFTVIELMVVAGIMILMLTLTIANFRGFEKNQILDTEASKLVSIIRQAQIWALTGQTSDNVRYSYGLHLEECTALQTCYYIFFKDIDQDYIYDSNEFISGGRHAFLKGVYIDAVYPSDDGSLDIVFEPPLAKIYFNARTAEIESNIILASSLAAGQERTITVNQESGQINMD